MLSRCPMFVKKSGVNRPVSVRPEHGVDYIVDGGRHSGRLPRPDHRAVEGFQLQRAPRQDVGVHRGVHLVQR